MRIMLDLLKLHAGSLSAASCLSTQALYHCDNAGKGEVNISNMIIKRN